MAKSKKKDNLAEGDGTPEGSLPVQHLISMLKTEEYWDDYVVGREIGPIEMSYTHNGSRITIDLGRTKEEEKNVDK